MGTAPPDWAARIGQDPAVMVGKPVVRGTRIPVARVVAQLAVSPAVEDLLAAYPELTIDDIRACLRCAQDPGGGPVQRSGLE